ncbi:hypothetical protein N9O24_00525 [bacterium]|nr:hypothetical protein [bacterium]
MSAANQDYRFFTKSANSVRYAFAATFGWLFIGKCVLLSINSEKKK